jgi:ferrous iron transport protein B
MVLLRTPIVALVGNPNTGKTTLFNALCGMRQRVGNYPGVTVETKKGKLRHGEQTFEVIDLPGTYSLAPRSPDEMVAVDLILGRQQGETRPDVVVTIVDASNLERNLYLMTQVLELGLPVVVALNMIDVAEGQGIRIDAGKLSRQLGVPVIPIQANKGKGLDRLKDAMAGALAASGTYQGPAFPEPFEREVASLKDLLGQEVPPYLVRRLLLDLGGQTERLLTADDGDRVKAQVRASRQRLADAGCPVPAVEARIRYGWIRLATAGCVLRPVQRPITWTDRLDRVLTHKLWGTFLFLALMFVVFQSIFTWAGPLMDLISGGQGALAEWVQGSMEPGPLRSLIVDGIIGGVGGVLVFLPQIMILFAFIAVLEDCGYMARAAFLMDKLMARCGLNGKSFIPLLSSVACAVPGIMATRVIENRRDRLATILVAPLMSCSARLPVYLLLTAAFFSPAQGYAFWVPGVVLFAMYAVGVVVAPLVALVLKRTLLRGEAPVFVMEMPLYKVPSPRIILQRMGESGWLFVRRAGTLILATMIVVWAFLYFPSREPRGSSYDLIIADLEERLSERQEEHRELKEAAAATTHPGLDNRALRLEALDVEIEVLQQAIKDNQRDWRSQSILGRLGQTIEPAVRPLGWDWRLGMAALASFPAREVMVGALGLIYSQGQGEADDEEYRAGIGAAMAAQTWDDDPARKVFTAPVALSVMVFFALCCQCASTLAVIKRETNSWRWPIFTFVYMTALAYLGALLVYQVGSLFG